MACSSAAVCAFSFKPTHLNRNRFLSVCRQPCLSSSSDADPVPFACAARACQRDAFRRVVMWGLCLASIGCARVDSTHPSLWQLLPRGSVGAAPTDAYSGDPCGPERHRWSRFGAERIIHAPVAFNQGLWSIKYGEHHLMLRVRQPQVPKKCTLQAGVGPAGVGSEQGGDGLQPAAHQRQGEHRW